MSQHVFTAHVRAEPFQFKKKTIKVMYSSAKTTTNGAKVTIYNAVNVRGMV